MMGRREILFNNPGLKLRKRTAVFVLMFLVLQCAFFALIVRAEPEETWREENVLRDVLAAWPTLRDLGFPDRTSEIEKESWGPFYNEMVPLNFFKSADFREGYVRNLFRVEISGPMSVDQKREAAQYWESNVDPGFVDDLSKGSTTSIDGYRVIELYGSADEGRFYELKWLIELPRHLVILNQGGPTYMIHNVPIEEYSGRMEKLARDTINAMGSHGLLERPTLPDDDDDDDDDQIDDDKADDDGLPSDGIPGIIDIGGDDDSPVPSDDDGVSPLGIIGILGGLGAAGAAIAAILGKIFGGGAAAGKVAVDSAAASAASTVSTASNASDASGGGQSSIPPVSTGGMGVPAQQGGPGDNPSTAFEGGDGPGDCARQGLPNYWVNTSILNLVIQDTVYTWSGLGPSVDLTLTYNSGSTDEKGMFGSGWRFIYEGLLVHSGSEVTVSKGSGQKETFTMPDEAENASLPVELNPSSGCYNRLLYYGNYWLYIKQGSKFMHRFDQAPGTQQARLTMISDYHGNALKINFDEHGNIGSLTDAVGRAVKFSYNEAGMCTSFVLPDGRTASFGYDGSGNLAQAVDLLGVTSDYHYDGESCLIRMVVGREKKTTTFSYRNIDNVKRLTAVTDARGHTTGYEMVASEPVQVKVTCPKGKTTLYFSRQGITEKIIDPLGNYQEFTYRDGLQVDYRDKNGDIITREYDQLGNQVAVKDAAGNITRYQYDPYSNLVKIVNPLGQTWSFAYDERQNMVRAVSPLNAVTTMEYDSLGRRAAMVDANGQRTAFGCDKFGNIEKVTDPLGRAFVYGYDDWGLCQVSVTDPLGQITRFEYDHNDRLLRVQNPDGTDRSHVYNCCAGIVTTDESGSSTGYERDPLLNITRSIDHLANHTNYRYDANNNLVEISEVTGQKTAMSYDDAGRFTQVIDALGQKTAFSYDPEGNLVVLKDPLNRETHFTRNAAGFNGSVKDQMGNTVMVKQDAVGRVSEITNARKNQITYDYDGEGRMTRKSYDGVEFAAYHYDAVGNMVKMKDRAGTTSYTYDAANQLASIDYPDGKRVIYTYEKSGKLASIVYPGGLKVEYGYDRRSRVNEVRWGENRISYKYDAVGNLLEENRSNGTVSRYTYNSNYWLVRLEHVRKGESFCDIQYSRDGVGKIVEETGLYPLDFPLEDKENRLFNADFNQLNQFTIFQGSRCSYDSDGNLTEIEGGLWQAGYDPENHLETTTRNGRFASYLYSGLGHRIQSSTDSSTRRFYSDLSGNVLCEEKDGQLIFYIYDGFRLAAMANARGETFFYHFDKIGSTLALTDKTGVITAAYSYTPLGENVGKGDTAHNPFTFVGAYGVMEEGENLYFMKRRYYDARTGRFIQKDPIGIQGGINQYAYAENNPLLYVDPEGTEPITTAVLIWGALKWGGAALTVYSVASTGKKVYDTRQAYKHEQELGEKLKNAQAEYRNAFFGEDVRSPSGGTQRVFPRSHEIPQLKQRVEELRTEYNRVRNGVTQNIEELSYEIPVTSVETVAIPFTANIPYTLGKKTVSNCLYPD